MPTIKNEEFTLVVHHYERNSKDSSELDHIQTTNTVSFFDLFVDLAGKLDPNTGLGNFDEQLLRRDLIGRFKAAIDEKKESVTIGDAPAEFLKRHVVNLNPLVICDGFIDFQKLIRNWK